MMIISQDNFTMSYNTTKNNINVMTYSVIVFSHYTYNIYMIYTGLYHIYYITYIMY